MPWPMYQQEAWEAPGFDFLALSLAFVALSAALDLTLDWRQHRVISKHLGSTTLPSELRNAILALEASDAAPSNDAGDAVPAADGDDGAAADDAKPKAKDQSPRELLASLEAKLPAALAYQHEKSCFGFVSSAFVIAEALVTPVIGLAPFYWDLCATTLASMGLPSDEISTSLAFAGLLTVQGTLFSLPFTMYSQLVIEARHGFNKMSLGLLLTDQLQTLIITCVIGGPVLAAFIYIAKWAGSWFVVAAWALIAVVTFVMLTVYPLVIAPLFNKFTKLADLDQHELSVSIAELAQRTKFPLSEVFVVDGSKRSSHSNAYFYGVFTKRICLFDTLLQQMSREEICAVLGHELGHWRLGHILTNLAIMQLYIFSVFGMFSIVMRNQDLYRSFGFEPDAEADSFPIIVGLVLFFNAIFSPLDKLLSLAMNINSRRNELQADAFAYDLGFGEELERALIKLNRENLGVLNFDKLYSVVHFSHPPLVERLRALRQLNTSASKKRA